MPGVTIGVPIGALPPSGLYYGNQTNEFSFDIKNNSGKDIGVHVNALATSNQLLYVPAIPQILGATYGAFVVQPIAVDRISAGGSANSAAGLVNTVLSPVNLLWNLHNGFFVSANFNVYAPDSDYHLNDIVHVGRNYVTFEPNIGISYLSKNWKISLHPVLDFNTTNPANDYSTGTIFSMDYSAMYKIDKFEFGVGGTVIQQITNDTQNGAVVAGIPGIRGFGNKASNFTVGPYIGYDFGPVSLSAYYTRSVRARNTGAGDTYFATLFLPLTPLLGGPDASASHKIGH